MALVKINTSDTEWITRRGQDEPVVHGTDIKGAVYFQTVIEVASIERTTFAGAKMIRFDLGTDLPSDALNRAIMCPESYLVSA